MAEDIIAALQALIDERIALALNAASQRATYHPGGITGSIVMDRSYKLQPGEFVMHPDEIAEQARRTQEYIRERYRDRPPPNPHIAVEDDEP